jgi:hypothetical protein
MMMLDQIEKRRADMLACDHPFILQARMTEQTLNKTRSEYLEIKSQMQNKRELASHSFIEAKFADDLENNNK